MTKTAQNLQKNLDYCTKKRIIYIEQPLAQTRAQRTIIEKGVEPHMEKDESEKQTIKAGAGTDAAEGGRMTISDVAEALNISKTTVSRAISGKGRIGAETRRRVLDYIEKYNYKPSVIAKGLAQSKSYNIGWVMPSDYTVIDLPFFQKCLMGLLEMASPIDYDVLVCTVAPDDISQLERVVENHKVDGIVLGRTLVNDAPARYLKEKGVPFVVVGSMDDDSVIQVDHDHRSACRELTSIILAKGMTKVALMGGNKNHVVTMNRFRGYIDAMEDMGVRVDNSLIYFDIDNSVLCEHAVDEMMKQKTECILCMDDGICQSVLNALDKKKIKIPRDVRVASFYNSSLLSNYQPAITSLQFDPRELGMVACRLLVEYIEGGEVRKKTHLGYELRLKESTK